VYFLLRLIVEIKPVLHFQVSFAPFVEAHCVEIARVISLVLFPMLMVGYKDMKSVYKMQVKLEMGVNRMG